jgi:hypothetical protein
VEGSTAAVKAEPHCNALPRPVPNPGRDLVGHEAFDYSDAFVLGPPAGDRCSAEVWARAMFTPSGRISSSFATTWGFVTGVQSPRRGKRVGYFKVVTPDRGATVWTADGPRYRIHLVVLVDDGRVTFATFVKAHSIIWREVLKGIMVAHRRVAPLLMERALGRLSKA